MAPGFDPLAIPDADPRERLRSFLRAETPAASELARWVTEAAARAPGNGEAQLALEELVGHVGWRLGFDPVATSGEVGEVWISPEGAELLVFVTAGPVGGQLPRWRAAREGRLSATLVRRQDDLSVLCVLNGAPADPEELEQLIKVRRAGDAVRVTTLEALLALDRLVEQHGLAHAEVLAVLRPQPVLADPVVALLVRLAGT